MTPELIELERRARGNMEGRLQELCLYMNDPNIRDHGGIVRVFPGRVEVLSIQDHQIQDDNDIELQPFWYWPAVIEGVTQDTNGHSIKPHWRVLLSWGGPSDFFKIYYTPMIGRNRKLKNPWHVEYVYQDWGEGFTIDVSERKEVHQLIEYLAQFEFFMSYNVTAKFDRLVRSQHKRDRTTAAQFMSNAATCFK